MFVFDDTSFPKQGKHSVGVQRQYCGALGKRANCQVAPSLHYVRPKGHYPLAMRLYLPESWTDDAKRLDEAGVPEERRRAQTKGQIALELLDQVRGEGLPGRLVVADAGYGVSGDIPRGVGQPGAGLHRGGDRRDGRLLRGADLASPAGQKPGAGGRPAARSRLAEGSPRPVSLKGLAATTTLRKVTWREGTKGKLSGRFAWVRVWPGSGWATGECAKPSC